MASTNSGMLLGITERERERDGRGGDGNAGKIGREKGKRKQREEGRNDESGVRKRFGRTREIGEYMRKKRGLKIAHPSYSSSSY